MPLADPIEHVVAIMLENQSFDRLLGSMRSLDPAVDGVDPNALRGNVDPTSGAAISQAPTTARSVALDPGHDLDDVLRQIGNNDCSGFIADFVGKYPQSSPADRQEVMGYYPVDALPALDRLARNFGVCDHWYSSVPGPTWPNRFFVHSGTSLGHTDMPTGFDPNIQIYDQPTIYERLEEHGIPWRIYFGDFPQSLVLTRQWRFPDHYLQMNWFFQDAAGPSQLFPAYSFIEPTYFGDTPNDEHPSHDMMRGESLLATVYNALRSNEDLWPTTLLIVLYDEHGGFYDHVPPPAAVPPDEHTSEFAFDRYGLRTPALLVSPWIERSVISTVFDHTSVLRYLSDKWDLPPLGNRAAQANSFRAELLKRSSPRTDTPPSIDFTSPALAGEADRARRMNRHQNNLLAFSRFLETHLAPGQAPALVVDRERRAFEGPAAIASVIRERLSAFLYGERTPPSTPPQVAEPPERQ